MLTSGDLRWGPTVGTLRGMLGFGLIASLRGTFGIGLFASALLAGAVVAAGLGMQPPLPSVPSFMTERPGCLPLSLFEIDRSGVGGRALVCIVDEGVRVTIDAEGLVAGTIYTALLAYFDRPGQCGARGCGIADLLGDDPAGIVVRFDGVEATGTRKASFRGDMPDLRLSSGSQATLLLVERGPAVVADGKRRAQQLLGMPVLAMPGTVTPSAGPGARVVAQAILDLP